jgi:uncharacterized membrane protein YkoI
MMKARKRLLALTIVLGIGAVGLGGAYAAENGAGETNDQADLQMMMQAKVSLTGAVQAAESAQGGKALSASFENNSGQPAYQVELATADGNMASMLIDGNTGIVLKTLTDVQQGDQGENGQSEEGEVD